MINRLIELSKEFNNVPRMGKDKDIPEGARFVKMSDTLLKIISGGIEDIGCEINRIIYWYNTEINDPTTQSMRECPVCGGFWLKSKQEQHKPDCWIPTLKRIAFTE